MSQQNDFSKGSIPKTITRLALPMIAAMLVNALYSVVDRIYIGHLPDIGQTALTGIGLCYPITMAISAFSYLIGNGGGPLTSIMRGAKDEKGAEKVLGNSITLLTFFGILVPVICFLIKKPLLYLFGASDATYPYADEYITIYLMGSLAVMFTLGLNPFLNAQGFTKTGMMTVLVGAVCNIVLDPIFIFIFDMGVAGVRDCNGNFSDNQRNLDIAVFAGQEKHDSRPSEKSPSGPESIASDYGIGFFQLYHECHRGGNFRGV